MKTKTLSYYKKRAWTEFSRYIRQSNADKNGMVKCYTCGVVKHWKKQQAGHGIAGRSNAVLFLEAVVKPQCVQCNIYKYGNKDIFTQKLEEEMGLEIFNNIRFMSKQSVKYSILDYQDIETKYKELLKDYVN
jgi:hypothetical protein